MTKDETLHRAMFAYPTGENLRCRLCAHECVIEEGSHGRCQVRVHRGGTLYSRVYGRTVARHVDPIEKKPLFHFQPGSRSLSMAAPGCNMRCPWCQNWEISQCVPTDIAGWGEPATPKEIVAQARAQSCRSISFTYTEPTIFFEYAYDIARQATSAGLSTVFVTNGYMTGEALTTIAPVLDAASVDLKAFSDRAYQELTGARLRPVLDTLERMRDLDLWIEVTTLIVPDVNDDASQLRSLAAFIADALGRDTPWHISRFFPAYRMSQAEPTPAETLRSAARIGAEAGLRYVYAGNVGGRASTVCSSCGASLIERSGFDVVENRVTETSGCPSCGAPVAGVELAPSRPGERERAP